jgi:hypothetical protein
MRSRIYVKQLLITALPEKYYTLPSYGIRKRPFTGDRNSTDRPSLGGLTIWNSRATVWGKGARPKAPTQMHEPTIQFGGFAICHEITPPLAARSQQSQIVARKASCNGKEMPSILTGANLDREVHLKVVKRCAIPISDGLETCPVGIAAARYIAVQPISYLAQLDRGDPQHKAECGA